MFGVFPVNIRDSKKWLHYKIILFSSYTIPWAISLTEVVDVMVRVDIEMAMNVSRS